MTSRELETKLRTRYPAIDWQVNDPSIEPDATAYWRDSILIGISGRITLHGHGYVFASLPLNRNMLDCARFDVVEYVAERITRGIGEALLTQKPEPLQVV